MTTLAEQVAAIPGRTSPDNSGQFLDADAGRAAMARIVEETQGATIAANPLAPGSVARSVEDKLAEVVSVKDFGAVGDGVTDDSPAIVAAFASGAGRVTFPTPAGSYWIGATCLVPVTRDLHVDFQHSLITTGPGAGIKFYRGFSYTLTLAANITADSLSFTVSDASSVSVGDLIYISTTVTAETTGSTTANATVLVHSISGNVITANAKIKMPINTTDAGLSIKGYTQPGRLQLDNFRGDLIGATSVDDPVLTVDSLARVAITRPDIRSDYGWQAGGSQRGWGIFLNKCIDVTVDRPRLETLSYGIAAVHGGDVTVIKPTAHGCRHPCVPHSWISGMRILDLSAYNCYGAIDSHSAFDVAYIGGRSEKSQTLPNLRCVGGIIDDHYYHMYGDDTEDGPYYHYLALTANATGLYDTARLELRNFVVHAPNRTKSVVGCSYGHFIGSNIRANLVETALFNTVASLELNNCRNYDGTRWSRVGVRFPATIAAQPPLPAVLDNGVYHINPYATLIQQDNGLLRCWGTIARDLSGSPQALTIRIHDNAFPGTSSPTYVLGVIKFRGWVRHGTSGLGDIQGSEFHFFHKAGAATSAITFPTTAARADGATGQSNEDLTVVISSPAQSGFSQVGTGGDFYTEIVVTLTSAKTTPIFALSYELELMRMT